MPPVKISKELLEGLYLDDKKSVSEISDILDCSANCVNYWLKKLGVPKRSISEAIYIKNNPGGDPFKVKERLTAVEMELKGLGMGLYWGEGHKKNKVSIRLGNTDPDLIRNFIDFLTKICGVKREDIGFNLIIFNDIDPSEARKFWITALNIRAGQIKGKVTVLKSGSVGTYRRKSKYGVIILQYHNKKLRDIICNMIEKLR